MNAPPATAQELAKHLRATRDEVIQAWVAKTKRDDKVEDARHLSDQKLVDHLPAIYAEMCETIEHGGVDASDKAKLARTARLHGYYRWAEGYELEELVRELQLFRRTVIEKTQAFCAQVECNEKALEQCVVAVEETLLEVTLNSVRQHMHQYQVRVEASLSERREAEHALQAADTRKDQFLAMLAHELRNPLAPIRSAVQILLTIEEELPREAARAALVIDRQSQQLNRLVNELLDVARLTSGRISLKRVDVELRSVLRQAVEQTTPLIEARGHTLEVSLGDRPIYVDGDPGRLTQIFGNLLTNAAKYTDREGSIKLEVAIQQKSVTITVSDNGMGISAEVIPHIFDIFTQSPRTLDRAEGGLGIGLTLVKTIIEMHGGTVSARSDGENLGSIFCVTLNTIESAQLPMAEGATASTAATASTQKVLIVDDNQDASATLAQLLELLGYRVRTASDGPSAIDSAKSFAPQAIVLDIGLPGMNGFELCRAFRNDPAFSDTTIIALTGYGQPEDRKRVREAGFDFHLIKPAEVGEICKLLDLAERTKPRTG